MKSARVTFIRRSGYVFCAKCSDKRLVIPRIKFTMPERVCDECFLAVKCNRCEANPPTFSGPTRKQSLTRPDGVRPP